MLCFQPAAKLGQGGHVHLLQLVQQHKTAVRVQAADDGGGYPQLVTAGHIPPVLSFISKGTVLHTQLRQGQVGTVQQGHAVSPLLGDGFGELVVVAGIPGRFILGAGLFQVGPDLAVGLLDAPDGCLQLCGGFVLQLGNGLFGIFPLVEQFGVLGIEFLILLFQLGNAFTGAFQFGYALLLLTLKLCVLCPQPLILAVPGQDLLLLADEVGGADRFFRGIGVGDQLLGKVLFLLGQLAGEGALVVQRLDLQIPDVQLGADADDAQQDVSFLLVGCFHEAGQVKGQRLDKGVEQLLAAAPSGGVGNGQAGVFALALHDHAVGKGDLEVGGSHGPVPLCGIWAEAVAAQGPGKGIQHTGLALIVIAAHEGEPSGGRGERNCLDALDVFGLKGRDGYRHLDTSPWICPSV